MSTVKIFNPEGAASGEVTVDDGLLVSDRGEQAVKDAVVAYLAAQRQGSASTLSKGEVRGTGAKPWKQKGTGRARAGYKQSPIWRGGGVAFGPKPRDYSKKMNRKTARLAFRRALSDRIADDSIRVVESFGMDAPKTKEFAKLLSNLAISGPTLVVLGELDANVALSARNIDRVEIATADTVNTYQLVRYKNIVADKAGMDRLAARLSDEKADAS